MHQDGMLRRTQRLHNHAQFARARTHKPRRPPHPYGCLSRYGQLCPFSFILLPQGMNQCPYQDYTRRLIPLTGTIPFSNDAVDPASQTRIKSKANRFEGPHPKIRGWGTLRGFGGASIQSQSNSRALKQFRPILRRQLHHLRHKFFLRILIQFRRRRRPCLHRYSNL